MSSVLSYPGALAYNVKEIPSFFLRYVGSKSTSCFEALQNLISDLFKKNVCGHDLKINLPWTKNVERLSSETIISENFLVYGCLNAAIHKSDNSWAECVDAKMISPKTIFNEDDLNTSGIQIRENCFFDPKSGLKIGVFIRENTLILAYGAMGSHSSEVAENSELDKKLDWQGIQNGTKNLFGITPAIYHQAEEFTGFLLTKLKAKDSFEKLDTHLTGQCFGGSLATYVALKKGLKATCVNSLPIGAGLQKEIDSDRITNADQYITHAISNGDLFANCKVFFIGRIVRLIDFLCTRILCIKTPGNFGKVYQVQNECSMFYGPKKLIKVHQLIVSSMLQEIFNRIEDGNIENKKQFDEFVNSALFQKIKSRVERYKTQEG